MLLQHMDIYIVIDSKFDIVPVPYTDIFMEVPTTLDCLLSIGYKSPCKTHGEVTFEVLVDESVVCSIVGPLSEKENLIVLAFRLLTGSTFKVRVQNNIDSTDILITRKWMQCN